MSKGTPSMGRRKRSIHIRCRRCGKATFHIKKGVCSSCGYGRTAKLRRYAWQGKNRKGKHRKY